jgi:SAM-dependent methyltransferase
VYTPREVAAAMVELVLAPLVAGKTADEILALRVCDPALGEGVFLVEVVRVLADAIVDAAARGDGLDRELLVRDARARVVAQCIVGVDIDARAVDTARAALGASTETLRVADATTLDWRAAFPDVFARGGFDVVVGNPPYIRQERLGSKQAMRGYASYHGVADLYVYFIELAHRVLRPRGRFCLIVPNKWLTVAYARALRAFLAEQASVEGVVDLSRVKLFADADAFPCIVWGTVGGDRAQPIVAARPEAETPVDVALREAVTPHARVAWGTEPWHIEVASERALLERMEKRWPRLGDVVTGKASRGVVTGCNRAFVIDRETRDSLVAKEPKARSLIRPFVKGRDVKRWRMADVERWILMIDRGTDIDALPAVHAHLLQFRDVLEPKPSGWNGAWNGRKPGAYAWHELQDPVGPLVKARGPRLLFQDIQTAPACALDATGELAPDTTVWMLPTADRVVLALLNSPLYGWYAKRRFPPALNGAVRPKLEYMRALPVAEPSASARRAIEALVDRRLEGEALDAEIADAIYDLYEVSTTERHAIAND